MITGGGSQLKYLPQLFEYVTGMNSRVGYPNEHVGKGIQEDITSPLFATGIGLVMKGYENQRAIQRPETVQRDTSFMKAPNFFDKIKRFFDEEIK